MENQNHLSKKHEEIRIDFIEREPKWISSQDINQ